MIQRKWKFTITKGKKHPEQQRHKHNIRDSMYKIIPYIEHSCFCFNFCLIVPVFDTIMKL